MSWASYRRTSSRADRRRPRFSSPITIRPRVPTSVGSSVPRDIVDIRLNIHAPRSESDRVGLDRPAEDLKATDDLREDGKAIIVEGKIAGATEGWVRAPSH